MPREYTQFAYKENTKEIVHIDEVENGNNCNCVCISCGNQLTAKQGKIKKHHFAHRHETNCAGSHETLLHLLAKEVIKEERELYLPELIIQSNNLKSIYTKEKIFFNKKLNLHNIKIEKKEGDIQPDLSADIVYNDEKYKIYIEVGVTHFVEEEKKKYIKDNNINCIEINLKKIYKKVESLSIKKLKEKIKSYLKSNSKYISKWINENIIDKEKEIKKLNEENEKKFKFISKKIIDHINENTEFDYDFITSGLTLKKDNFFGKYDRHINANIFENINGFKIKKVINKDYENNEVRVLINCFGIDKEFCFIINQYIYSRNKENIIYINSMNIFELLSKFNENLSFEKIKKGLEIKLREEDFYDEEKILSNYTPQKELDRYRKFIKSIKNKKIKFPNPSFDEVELDLEKKIYLNIPSNLKKESFEVLIRKVEVVDKKNPNILRLYYTEYDYLYLVFSSEEENVKKIELYKQRYKNKKSILYCKFDGNTSFKNFQDFDWTKCEIKYKWLYHKGFEELKLNFINALKIDFKEGCRIFYSKYIYKLTNIRKAKKFKYKY